MKKNISKIFLASIVFAFPLSAFATPILRPFGGMVSYFVPCTCNTVSGAVQTLVVIPTLTPPLFAEAYIYTLGVPPVGTILYRNNLPIKPSTWILGLADPVPIPCMVYSGPSCVEAFPFGKGFPMTMVGTSF